MTLPERERIGALIGLIVRARVGGTFWAPAAGAVDKTILLRPRSADEARRMADMLEDGGAQRALVLLPDLPWAAAAGATLGARGIAVEIGEVDPWPLLDAAREVHAAGDDELALLALLAGIPVRCHGDGAIAGWGLTRDEAGIPPKGVATIESLAAAILIEPVRYRDCFTGEPADAEAAVERLTFWRGCIDASRDLAAAAGIAMWKRREVAAMLWAGRREPLQFFQRAVPAVGAAAAAGGAVAVWPSRAPAGLDRAAAEAGVPLYRVEDGFIRSVGLGSACHPPLSIVVDRRGLYYDATRPSDLEHILEHADFPPELLARADALADFVVRAGISKYAAGRGDRTAARGGARRQVLVPGQVEDDLSVRLGGGEVAGNLDLLRRARKAEPDAELIFKPHPDVDAGHRAGHVADADALRYADRVVRDVAMPALLDQVDAVHVLTSLTGFEALLRGREVVTHGAPFYAGWGLTRDLAPPLTRRTRRLTLAELVAGALILYPRYLDPVTGLPCPPETLVARLAEQSAPRSTWLTRVRGMQGRLRRPRRWARSAA